MGSVFVLAQIRLRTGHHLRIRKLPRGPFRPELQRLAGAEQRQHQRRGGVLDGNGWSIRRFPGCGALGTAKQSSELFLGMTRTLLFLCSSNLNLKLRLCRCGVVLPKVICNQ